MTTVTSAELKQRALQGIAVTPAELASAKQIEEAERELAQLAIQRQNELSRKAAEQRAERESKPIHDVAADLAPQREIKDAIAAVSLGIRQYFEAGAAYNAKAEELRRDATAVVQISPSAQTGITVRPDTLIIGGYQIASFDAGEQGLLARVQEAIYAAKGTEVV